jgi:hypothetical protein
LISQSRGLGDVYKRQGLKDAMIVHINQLLEPVRDHFSYKEQAELLKQVKSYTK